MKHIIRGTLGRFGLAAAIMTAGCRDLTAPEGSLALVVSPATFRIDEFSVVRVTYTMRNSDALALTTNLNPDVQAELSPGAWTNVAPDPNAMYIQDALGGSTFAANHSEQRMTLRPLTPGRYRLRMTYWRASSTGTRSGPEQEAISNAFDVVR